ncbi:MAG: N4-gp56 family major capsid protein [Clostridia bacterium]|nr:N4-gp56 family major capsid protein [Clostridia bacterium]
MSINTTLNTVGKTGLNKTFYDRALLESAKTRLVHAKFGQKRPIPANSGKRVEFRRWNLFDVEDALTPLTEGVTPESQSLSQTEIEAEVEQYGAYVEVSDLLSVTAYDQVLSDSAELLGEQLGTVVEWITRDAMCSGNNVQYAGGKANRAALTADDKLTVEEIRKAVRTLKKAKARMFDEGGRKPHFICICSPESTYDLQSDELWQNVSAYANAEQIYSGEIGRLFGVVFVESTEAKIFAPSINDVTASGSTASVIKLTNPLSYAAKAAISAGGCTVTIGDNSGSEIASYDEEANTITLVKALSAAPSAGTKVLTEDAGENGADVHATLVFGKDAYGIVDVAGNGALQIIIKDHGSAGASDPLNQRATVGAKVAAYACKILNDLWLLRIEHRVSA